MSEFFNNDMTKMYVTGYDSHSVYEYNLSGGPLLNKYSVSSTGFTGGDPYDSGNPIDFTVQSGDALAVGMTYYWRVEAIDPSGTNTYGDWSSIYSFSVTTPPVISANATGYSFQRKTWYDGTNYWKSFYTGSQVEFWHSTDGSVWIQDSSATLPIPTNDFSIEADSSNCFIVYTSGDNINGRVASNYPGTGFGWGGESTVFSGSGTNDQYEYPVIARDSSSYVWVGASYTGSGIYDIKTIRGLSTPNILPADLGGDMVYTLSDPANSNSNVFGVIVPQTSQNMYETFTVGTALHGCVWVNGSTAWQDSLGNSCDSGANFDSIATVSSGISNNMSAVADPSGNVHLTYVDSNGYVLYQEYTSSAWQSPVTLDGNSGNGYVSMSLDTSNNSVYSFWVRGDHIYYKHGVSPFASGNWDASSADWHSGTNLTNLTTNYSGNAKVFAEWTSDTGSPYTVNWDTIAVPENLWFLFSLGIAIPLYRKRKVRKNEQGLYYR
jgi:hypothetical protein